MRFTKSVLLLETISVAADQSHGAAQHNLGVYSIRMVMVSTDGGGVDMDAVQSFCVVTDLDLKQARACGRFIT